MNKYCDLKNYQLYDLAMKGDVYAAIEYSTRSLEDGYLIEASSVLDKVAANTPEEQEAIAHIKNEIEKRRCQKSVKINHTTKKKNEVKIKENDYVRKSMPVNVQDKGYEGVNKKITNKEIDKNNKTVNIEKNNYNRITKPESKSVDESVVKLENKSTDQSVARPCANIEKQSIAPPEKSKKGFLLLVIIIILVLVVGGSGLLKHKMQEKQALEKARLAKIDNKKEDIRATAGNVLGTWYECDSERNDVRKLTLKVDDTGKCVFVLGTENGVFSYEKNQINLIFDTREGKIALDCVKDSDGNLFLDTRNSDINYYDNEEIIESHKTAIKLKQGIIGKWEPHVFDYTIIIKEDGTYEFWQEDNMDSSGDWTVKVSKEKIKLDLIGLKKWNYIYEEYNEIDSNNEWDINEYESLIEAIETKDIFLTFGYDFYHLVW